MFESIRPRWRHHCLAFLAAACTAAIPTGLAAQNGPPRVSPRAEISQTIGAATLDIVYSRPSARGRTIWGELVPYGDVWRTGANEATTLTVSHDVTIGDKTLAAGTYALFTIPGETNWTIVLNEVAEQWGSGRYDAEKDVLRFEATPRTVPMAESFTIHVPAFDAESATVDLRWARVAVAFDIHFDTDAATFQKAKAEITEAGMASRAAFGWARHYQSEGSHLESALEWINAVTNATDHYWTQSTRARILAQLDQHGEAKKAAEHAISVIDTSPNPEAAKNDAERLRNEMAAWP